MNIDSLKRFYDSLSLQVRSLTSLNVDIDQHSVFLKDIVFEKLPSAIRISCLKELERYNDNFSLTDLVERLNKEIDIIEQGSDPIVELPISLNKVSSDPLRVYDPCRFCGSKHIYGKCRDYCRLCCKVMYNTSDCGFIVY